MNVGNISIDALDNYIKKTATRIAKEESFNVVQKGTIVKSIIGGYDVRLADAGEENIIRNVLPLNSRDTFKEDDYVYLLAAPVASGDLDQTKYFIFGLVSDTREDFLNASDFERFTGVNTETYLASSFDFLAQEEKKIITFSNTDGIINDIQTLGAFAVTGIFSCLGVTGLRDYGLRFKFFNEDTLVKTIDFNTEYFIGQPFNMDAIEQTKVFIIDGNVEFDKIVVYGFYEPENEGTVPTGILFVSDAFIQAGSLADLAGSLGVQISAISNKNYFNKNDEQETIQFKAIVTYNGQELSGDSIQFYWVTNKESFNGETIDPERNLHFVEDDWYCINPYNTSSVLGTDKIIPVWDRQKNILTLTRKFNDGEKEQIVINDVFDATNYISKFVTQLKCVIKYQGVVATSDKIDIINYSKEDFKITITPNVDSLYLFLESDKIVLTANVTSSNKFIKMSDYDVTYQWYIDNEKIEGATDKQLIVRDNGKPNITNDDILSEYELNTESASFYCIATISKGGVIIDKEESEPVGPIFSKVAVAAELHQPTYYKYYISSSDGVLFKKSMQTHKKTNDEKPIEDKKYYTYENGIYTEIEISGDSFVEDIDYYEEDNSWTGDWIIEDPTGSDKTWINIINNVDNDAFNDLNNLTLRAGQYLYYTSQTKWYEQKPGDDTQVPLKTENWVVPRLLRGRLLDGTELPFETIDKINTFNDLTGGGRDQGFYLKDGEVYTRTKDLEQQEDKNYYYISGSNSAGLPIYTKLEGKWEENIIYYELVNSKKLYINAEYIQTGALKVGDNKGSLKFYADIDKDEVTIGGYRVGQNELVGGYKNGEGYTDTVGLNSDGSTLTNIAIWAGQKGEGKDVYPFQVTHNGALTSTAGKIANWTITGDSLYGGKIYSTKIEGDKNNSNIGKTIGSYLISRVYPVINWDSIKKDENTNNTIINFNFENEPVFTFEIKILDFNPVIESLSNIELYLVTKLSHEDTKFENIKLEENWQLETVGSQYEYLLDLCSITFKAEYDKQVLTLTIEGNFLLKEGAKLRLVNLIENTFNKNEVEAILKSVFDKYIYDNIIVSDIQYDVNLSEEKSQAYIDLIYYDNDGNLQTDAFIHTPTLEILKNGDMHIGTGSVVSNNEDNTTTTTFNLFSFTAADGLTAKDNNGNIYFQIDPDGSSLQGYQGQIGKYYFTEDYFGLKEKKIGESFFQITNTIPTIQQTKDISTQSLKEYYTLYIDRIFLGWKGVEVESTDNESVWSEGSLKTNKIECLDISTKSINLIDKNGKTIIDTTTIDTTNVNTTNIFLNSIKLNSEIVGSITEIKDVKWRIDMYIASRYQAGSNYGWYYTPTFYISKSIDNGTTYFAAGYNTDIEIKIYYKNDFGNFEDREPISLTIPAEKSWHTADEIRDTSVFEANSWKMVLDLLKSEGKAPLSISLDAQEEVIIPQKITFTISGANELKLNNTVLTEEDLQALLALLNK